MKSFDYVAVGPTGEYVQGRQRAVDEPQLDAELAGKGLVLTRARVVRAGSPTGSVRLRPGELLHLTNQLAFLVQAGIPLLQGLRGIETRTPAGPLRRLVATVAQRIEGGESLSEALDEHPRAFPRILRAGVRAGEASGSLDTVLVRVAKHMAWTRSVRATTMQALVYPAILASSILGLIAILLWFLLPRILTLLPAGDFELPWPTRVVQGASDWGLAYAPLLAGGAVALVVGVVLVRRSDAGRVALDRALLAIPGLGGVMSRLGTSKYAATTSVLHRAGCDAFQALEIAAGTADNAALEASFRKASARVRAGELLSEALAAEPHADPLLVQMVSVGERSGDLSGALDHLVGFYDEEVPREVRRFLSVLEPAILLVAGAIVAFVLLAVVLPMFEVYGRLG